MLTIILANLAETLIAADRIAEARPVFRETLELQRELQHRAGTNFVLRNAALIFEAHGNVSLAARIAGAADAETQATGQSGILVDLIGYEERIGRLRETMGVAEFDNHWNAGRDLAFDVALDEVWAGLDALESEQR